MTTADERYDNHHLVHDIDMSDYSIDLDVKTLLRSYRPNQHHSYKISSEDIVVTNYIENKNCAAAGCAFCLSQYRGGLSFHPERSWTEGITIIHVTGVQASRRYYI